MEKQALIKEIARELIDVCQHTYHYDYEKEEEVEVEGWPFADDGLGSEGKSFGAWLVSRDVWYDTVKELAKVELFNDIYEESYGNISVEELLEDVGERLLDETMESVIADVEHYVRQLYKELL